MAQQKNAWDRQDEEGAREFAAFTAYRDLGPSRSIDAAYLVTAKPQQKDSAKPKRKKRAPRHWFDWSVIFQWQERAEAYDSHLTDLEMAAREKATEQNALAWVERRELERNRSWELAEALAAKATRMLEFPLEVVETVQKDPETGKPVRITVMPAKWNMRDAARMIEAASRLARLAADMAAPGREGTAKGSGGDVDGDGVPVRYLVFLPEAPPDKDEWLKQYKPADDRPV